MTEKSTGKSSRKVTKSTPIKKKKPFTKAHENMALSKTLFLARFMELMNISKACKQININRATYYKWMKNDEKFNEDFVSCEESFKDYAEEKLVTLISEKNPTAIIFFLKTKCKDRGYIEPSYLNIKGSMNHNLIHRMSLSSLKKSYERINGKNKT